MPNPDPTNPRKPVAIRLWEELQALLKHEKSSQLDRDKFVLQKDAYMRLADEDIEYDVPFLSYEHNSVTHDEALDFSLYFSQHGFTINIGPTTFDAPYASFAHSAEEVLKLDEEAFEQVDVKKLARNILLTIKYLLNGQVALGCTFRSGDLLAVETFIFGLEDKPYPLAIAGNFGVFKRHGTDFVIKRNKLLSSHLEVPQDFPLLPPVVNGTRIRRGRTTDDIYDLTPLSKKEYDELETEIRLNEYTGKPAGQKTWSYIYSTVDFWVVAALVLPVIYVIEYASFVPNFLQNDWLRPVYLIASWFVISWATGILLARRQVKINAGDDPITARIERKISETFGRKK